jgi:hypothetical protein
MMIVGTVNEMGATAFGDALIINVDEPLQLRQVELYGRAVVLTGEDLARYIAGVTSPVAVSWVACFYENELARFHADIERLGRERDDMARAAQELQARLSDCMEWLAAAEDDVRSRLGDDLK